MTHLNNDHFQPDLETLETLNDFDETVSAPTIHSHDAYTKALNAVREQVELARLESLRDGPRRIQHGGCMIALDRERQPDKPGTVRKPGIRRQRQGTLTKKRWATV